MSVRERLLLRRHDPLERRVARLVDLLDDADTIAGVERLDHVVAVVGLPLDRDRRAVDVDLARRTSAAARRAARRASPARRDIRASVDSEPRITRSHSIGAERLGERRSTSRARRSRAAPSSTTWTALSAPIDSALRIVSAAFSGPMVRTVTSPPCASLSWSASSTAYSSSSFITASTRSRSSVLSVGLELLLGPRVGHLLDADDDVHCRSMVGERPPRVAARTGRLSAAIVSDVWSGHGIGCGFPGPVSDTSPRCYSLVAKRSTRPRGGGSIVAPCSRPREGGHTATGTSGGAKTVVSAGVRRLCAMPRNPSTRSSAAAMNDTQAAMVAMVPKTENA